MRRVLLLLFCHNYSQLPFLQLLVYAIVTTLSVGIIFMTLLIGVIKFMTACSDIIAYMIESSDVKAPQNEVRHVIVV
jgi:fructose-specific phosphotransferase system IIC component